MTEMAIVVLEAQRVLHYPRQLVPLDVIDHVNREVPIPLVFREAGPRILPWAEPNTAAGAVVTDGDVPHREVDVRTAFPFPGRDRQDFKSDFGVAVVRQPGPTSRSISALTPGSLAAA